ncbi:MAG: hypothetical protein K0R15_1605 [Clostridiales bacterium]|jgi:menaquinone-dependent protoporphyrinogen oxidase|nr:hypothetical protein [Clostridiales bacterium]
MKTAILYASKTGTTEKCAKNLAEKLTEVTLFDLRKELPDIKSYDTIIIGGSIRMGMLHKTVKKYIAQNLELLKTKRTAYFICCATVGDLTAIKTQNFDKELLNSAICFESFGGEMEIANLKGLDKFIAKMVTKNGTKGKPSILDNNIKEFAKKILG